MPSNLRNRLVRLESARPTPDREALIDRLLVQLNAPDADGFTLADELYEQFAGVVLHPDATPEYRTLARLFRPNDTEESS